MLTKDMTEFTKVSGAGGRAHPPRPREQLEINSPIRRKIKSKMNVEQKHQELKKMEERMNELITRLSLEYKFDLGERTLDSEGFPRGDIDVYSVRKLVGEYYQIKGEWKTLREELMGLLEARFGRDSDLGRE
jgi:hypothetical protein